MTGRKGLRSLRGQVTTNSKVAEVARSQIGEAAERKLNAEKAEAAAMARIEAEQLHAELVRKSMQNEIDEAARAELRAREAAARHATGAERSALPSDAPRQSLFVNGSTIGAVGRSHEEARERARAALRPANSSSGASGRTGDQLMAVVAHSVNGRYVIRAQESFGTDYSDSEVTVTELSIGTSRNIPVHSNSLARRGGSSLEVRMNQEALEDHAGRDAHEYIVSRLENEFSRASANVCKVDVYYAPPTVQHYNDVQMLQHRINISLPYTNVVISGYGDAKKLVQAALRNAEASIELVARATANRYIGRTATIIESFPLSLNAEERWFFVTRTTPAPEFPPARNSLPPQPQPGMYGSVLMISSNGESIQRSAPYSDTVTVEQAIGRCVMQLKEHIQNGGI